MQIGGGIHQKLRDRTGCPVDRFSSSCATILDQRVDVVSEVTGKDAHRFEESLLVSRFVDHGVETRRGVQAQASQRVPPFIDSGFGVGDEVEHGQDRLAASVEKFDLIAVSRQDPVARVDHVQNQIRGACLTKRLRFVLEEVSRFLGAKEAFDQGGSVVSPVGPQAVDELEQSDRILESRCVPEVGTRSVVREQLDRSHLDGGAGARRHRTERGISCDGSHERGLAGVGVSDHADSKEGALLWRIRHRPPRSSRTCESLVRQIPSCTPTSLVSVSDGGSSRKVCSSVS